MDAEMNDDCFVADDIASPHDIAASARQLRFSEDGARAADAVEALLLEPEESVSADVPAPVIGTGDTAGAEVDGVNAGAGATSGGGAGAANAGAPASVGAGAGSGSSVGAASASAAATATPVLVYARVRPLSADENVRAEAVTMRVTGETTVTTTAPPTTGAQSSASRTTEYSFTRAFDESAGNETVFREAVEAGVDDALNRASSFLLFSYGMTGSGKTHTVNGSSSDPGVLPRTLARVFRFVERSNRERATAGDTSADLIVTLSYLEVYNEKVYDLFADTRVPLDVVAAPSGKMHVRGMRQMYLRSRDAAAACDVEGGCGTDGAPSLLSVLAPRTGAIQQGYTQLASIALVDLAGSERAARTAAAGAALEQANAINSSLSHLMRCFTTMVERAKEGSTALRGFAYRESKLTHLLWDRLQGPAAGRVAMILCAGPAACDFSENSSTLRYSVLIKSIKIVANDAPSRAAVNAAAAARYDRDGRRIGGGVAGGGAGSGVAAAAQPSEPSAAALQVEDAAPAVSQHQYAELVAALESARAAASSAAAEVAHMRAVNAHLTERVSAAEDAAFVAAEDRARAQHAAALAADDAELAAERASAIEDSVRDEMSAAAAAALTAAEENFRLRLARLKDEEAARTERLLRLQSLQLATGGGRGAGGRGRASVMIRSLLHDAGVSRVEAAYVPEEDEEMGEGDDDDTGGRGMSRPSADSFVSGADIGRASEADTGRPSDAAGGVGGDGAGGRASVLTLASACVKGGAGSAYAEATAALREAEDELERVRSAAAGVEVDLRAKLSAAESARQSAEMDAARWESAAHDAEAARVVAESAAKESAEAVREADQRTRDAEAAAAQARAAAKAAEARSSALAATLEAESASHRDALTAARTGAAGMAAAAARTAAAALDAARATAATAISRHDELAGAVDGYRARIKELEIRCENFGAAITSLRESNAAKDARARTMAAEFANAIRGAPSAGGMSDAALEALQLAAADEAAALRADIDAANDALAAAIVEKDAAQLAASAATEAAAVATAAVNTSRAAAESVIAERDAALRTIAQLQGELEKARAPAPAPAPTPAPAPASFAPPPPAVAAPPAAVKNGQRKRGRSAAAPLPAPAVTQATFSALVDDGASPPPPPKTAAKSVGPAPAMLGPVRGGENVPPAAANGGGAKAAPISRRLRARV